MSDPPSYDLREQRWIPVVMRGALAWVGLRELFARADEIEDLALPLPPAAAGLLRICYAIALRISGLDDLGWSAAAWLKARDAVLKAGRFDAGGVGKYFDRADLADRFDLYDEQRPFLQDPRLRDQCEKRAGVNTLVFDRASWSGGRWFGHFSDEEPTPLPTVDAVWSLIAALYYGPSGRCSTRLIDEPPRPPVSAANMSAGPLRSAISFHPHGRNLFETLVCGLAHPRDVEETRADLCPWEEELPDPLRPAAVTGPARLLTGRSRHAVLLVPAPDGASVIDAYLTWATRAAPSVARDPYVVIDVGKDGNLRTRKAEADRAVWRDLDALLRKGGRAHGFYRPPVFDDVGDLPRQVRRRLRVRVYGCDQDGQRTNEQFFTALTPAELERLEEVEPRKAVRVAACHQAAERLGDKLSFAARLAWAETISPPAGDNAKVRLDARNHGPWEAPALRGYWERCEAVFWRLLDNDEEPMRPFAGLAVEALREAVGNAERRQKGAKAVSHAIAVIRCEVPKPPPGETPPPQPMEVS
jgi:CRISPR system Cascade subunit CasA